MTGLFKSRVLRQEVYRNNSAVFHAGGYTTESGKDVLLPVSDPMLTGTKFYSEEFTVDNVDTRTDKVLTNTVNKDCLIVAKEMLDEGYNPAVLNLADADAAFRAFGVVDHGLAVYHRDRSRGAVLCYEALTASTAKLAVKGYRAAALDANVVEAGLHTAIGTSADADLELMRKLDVAHTDVESIEDNSCQSLGIYVTENAGSSLAGGDGADLGARAAKAHSALCHKGLGLRDLIERNADYLG
jgi:hypothetical protein